MEAGHRCAIPTCRNVPVELAHIDPWAKVKEHRFENMITLCPTCHTRYDAGQMDRLSMLGYKANLSVIGSRYSQLEQRVLEYFAANPTATFIQLSHSDAFHISYLIKDGILGEAPSGGIYMNGVPSGPARYPLTEDGAVFVQEWAASRPI